MNDEDQDFFFGWDDDDDDEIVTFFSDSFIDLFFSFSNHFVHVNQPVSIHQAIQVVMNMVLFLMFQTFHPVLVC